MGLGILSMSILSPILPLYLDSINFAPELLPLVIATFGSAAVIYFFVVTQGVPSIFTIFFFWGLVRSALYGPSRGYLGANTPPDKRATYMAIMTVVVTAARSFGALPSGFMADNLGYNSVFYAGTGIALAAGLVVLFGIRRIHLNKSVSNSNNSVENIQAPPVSSKINWLSLIPQFTVAILLFLGLGVLMTFGPLLATEVIGVQATEVGILFTIAGLASLFLGIPIGMLADRVGKKTFMFLGLLVSAATMLGISTADSYLWLVIFAVFNGLGLVMFVPSALGLLSESVPATKQGTIMGVYGGLCENAGMIIGSAAGGFVWGALGIQATFVMSSIAAATGALVCLIFVRGRTGIKADSFTQ